MPQYIQPSIVDQILDRADILEVVREFVPNLKKRGANFWALSPFKQEKTPSFSVHSGKQIFHCFATGKKGNVCTFLIEIEPMVSTWLEAMHWLAKKYDIQVQGKMSEGEQQLFTRKKRLLALCQFASNWYHEQLIRSSVGESQLSAFLDSRHLNLDEIKAFHLGYAPTGWKNFANIARQKGYQESELLESGLCQRNQQGELFDFFRDRLIFPVSDPWGNVVGFAGRAIGESDIKYLNIGETILYQKKQLLYGLDQAAQWIQAEDQCLLVEGYMDVIIPAAFGISHVVASCGTAFSKEQARLIKRFTQNVLILYDADQAGIQSACSVIDILISEGMTAEIVVLPDTKDPDSFIQDVGKASFQEYLQMHSQSGLSFLYQQLSKTYDPAKPAGKNSIIESLLKTIAKVKHPIIKNEYLTQIASLSGIEAKMLIQMIEEPSIILRKALKWDTYEKILLRLGLSTSPDFKRAEDGGIEIAYLDQKGKSLTRIEQGQKKPIERISTQFGNPYGIYLPQILRDQSLQAFLEAREGLLVIVQDELTADMLAQLGIAAIGICRPDGFRSGASRRKPARLLQQLLAQGARKLVYILSGEAFRLPPAKSSEGKPPYEDMDVRTMADAYLESLMLLTQCLPKIRIWAVYPDYRTTSFETRNPRWLEDLLLKQPEMDLESMLSDCVFSGESKDLLCAQEISDFTRVQHEALLRLDNPQRFFDFHGIQAIGECFRFGRKTFRVNPTTMKVVLQSEGKPEPDVKEIDGIYYARQRGDGWKDITNFKMICNLRIMGKGAFGIYTLTNRNTRQQRKIIISNLTFREGSKFAERVSEIPRLGAFSKATSSNLAELQQLVCEGAPEAVNLKRIMGYHIMASEIDETESNDTQAFWVFGNGLLNGSFRPANSQGIVEIENQRYFLPANSVIREDPERHDKRFERQQSFEYKESNLNYENWIQKVMTVYGTNGHKGFCFATMALYYDLILEKMGKVPLLHLVGPPGTGKNELIDSFSRLWGHIKWMDLQTSKITPAG